METTIPVNIVLDGLSYTIHVREEWDGDVDDDGRQFANHVIIPVSYTTPNGVTLSFGEDDDMEYPEAFCEAHGITEDELMDIIENNFPNTYDDFAITGEANDWIPF